MAIVAEVIDIYSWMKGDGFCVDIPVRFRRTVIDTVSKASLPATLLVGAFVASIELPCTGAVYLSITSMLAKQQSSWFGLLYLVIYNFIFVLPLVAIVTAIHLGLPWVEIEKAKESKRGFLHLISGIVLMLLGALMLLEII